MAKRTLSHFALIVALATGPATADIDARNYLSARSASMSYDFETAAQYSVSLIQQDPGNIMLLEQALSSLIAIGDFGRASEVATQTDRHSALIGIVQAASAGRSADWALVHDVLEANPDIGRLSTELLRGWADIGLGETERAMATFDALATRPGLVGFAKYHKALALIVAGEAEAAEALLSLTPEEGMPRTTRGVIAHVNLLAQLGRWDDASILLALSFGETPDQTISALRTALAAHMPSASPIATTAKEGVAEAFFSVARSLAGDDKGDQALFFAQLARMLNPNHADAVLLTARIYEDIERADLALLAYGAVPQNHPAYLSAQIARAAVYRRNANPTRATEVLTALAVQYPDIGDIQASLGDALRSLSRFEDADAAYTLALSLYREDQQPWIIYYTRAVARQRLDDWPGAEADYRQALVLNPGQPNVLNNLGYSLVVRGENLTEALAMIERAVRRDPQDGTIVDSLGWALFQLDQTDAALVQLERAVSLEAVDPIINDHLGDVYWTVGRLVEARFQWQRALSLDPPSDEIDRIRRKLELGLDIVLTEEADG
ncbi:MAG: tetratricopeptide repeat protein [Rhodobacteraceae bacterium]|nr:tetratricopeptide repeat protein [Paracoccaceae bacterium]